jgi:Flp pilus assembly protein TadB
MTVAFVVVFGCFVAAFIVLAVLVIRWARIRDRSRRQGARQEPADLLEPARPSKRPGPEGR